MRPEVQMQQIAPFTPLAHWAKQSEGHGWSRRQFLAGAMGASAALGGLLKPQRLYAGVPSPGRKLVVVTFGGGARDDETFSLLGQRNIPHLLHTLAPQSTFFPQVVNRGILGHYVATASIATGTYQSFDNFVAQPPTAPTLFEYMRKGLHRPASDAWVIAPSNGFDRLGASSHPGYGDVYGAEIVLPKRLLTLAAKTQNHSLTDYQSLLHDSYEMPSGPVDQGVQSEQDQAELSRMSGLLGLSLADFTAHARSLSSADELAVYITRRVMRQVAPSVLFVTLHDMDVAHSGAFSLYIDAIQRADRLVADLWAECEANPEYRGKTTLLLLPDFGRDADGEACGFQHHRTGSPMARTTWMMALGVGAAQGRIVHRPLESVDVVPTAGAMLGFETPLAQGKPVVELL